MSSNTRFVPPTPDGQLAVDWIGAPLKFKLFNSRWMKVWTSPARFPFEHGGFRFNLHLEGLYMMLNSKEQWVRDRAMALVMTLAYADGRLPTRGVCREVSEVFEAMIVPAIQSQFQGDVLDVITKIQHRFKRTSIEVLQAAVMKRERRINQLVRLNEKDKALIQTLKK